MNAGGEFYHPNTACLSFILAILLPSPDLHIEEDMNLTSSPLIGPEGPEPSVTTANIIRSGRLPQPQMGIIGEIDTAIKHLARTAVVKERVCEYIQNEVCDQALVARVLANLGMSRSFSRNISRL